LAKHAQQRHDRECKGRRVLCLGPDVRQMLEWFFRVVARVLLESLSLSEGSHQHTFHQLLL
jgi:hypothetical protein